MRKTLTCKPVPELEIQTEPGESIILRFDVYCVAKLQELDDDGLSGMLKKSLPELAAGIVYAAAEQSNPGFTQEDARKIVSFMCIEDIKTLVDEFSDSIGSEIKAQSEEYSKNLMAQFLNSLK